MVTKAQMLAAIQSLPDDATVADARERLDLLEAIDCGIAEIEAGKGIAHEDSKLRLAQWRVEDGDPSPLH